MKLEEKIEVVKKLKGEIKNYKTVGFIDLFKTPTKQFQEIKKNLSEQKKVKIKVYKKSILMHVFEKEIEKIKSILPDQAALIFSNEEPFELFSFINSLKSATYAKGGEIAKDDIVVKAGPTDLLPGPVISEFAKAKIPAGVEKGKIAIKKDTLVVKKGKTVSKNVASILRKLKIKVVDVGLNVVGFYHDGKVISKDVLSLVLEYPGLLAKAYKNAFNLTINIGYPTKENINMLLSIAYSKAKNLEKLIGGAN